MVGSAAAGEVSCAKFALLGSGTFVRMAVNGEVFCGS